MSAANPAPFTPFCPVTPLFFLLPPPSLPLPTFTAATFTAATFTGTGEQNICHEQIQEAAKNCCRDLVALIGSTGKYDDVMEYILDPGSGARAAWLELGHHFHAYSVYKNLNHSHNMAFRTGEVVRKIL